MALLIPVLRLPGTNEESEDYLQWQPLGREIGI